MARGKPAERLFLGVANDGHDEPSLSQVHCDAEVDVPMNDERVVTDRGVQMREVAQVSVRALAMKAR